MPYLFFYIPWFVTMIQSYYYVTFTTFKCLIPNILIFFIQYLFLLCKLKWSFFGHLCFIWTPKVCCKNSSLMPVTWKDFEIFGQKEKEVFYQMSFYLNIVCQNCYTVWSPPMPKFQSIPIEMVVCEIVIFCDVIIWLPLCDNLPTAIHLSKIRREAFFYIHSLSKNGIFIQKYFPFDLRTFPNRSLKGEWL